MSAAPAEIRMLAGLSHTGLVTVFDAGQDGAASYLVMELVTGTTLRRQLDDGPLTVQETARLGAAVAGALAYVHSRGIVHRDVKPANILIAEDATAKLTDFGVAKLLDAARITTTGTTLGTPNYLSPEQASGGPITGASDVYSLGLVLLECLTGVVALPGHGVAAAVARLHRQPEIPVGLGPKWVDLLARMTARDPGARPDPAAIASGLTAALDEVPTAGTATMVLDTVPAPTARRMRWLPVAAAAVVVAALATGLTLAFSGHDGPGSAPPSTPVRTSSPATFHHSSGSSTRRADHEPADGATHDRRRHGDAYGARSDIEAGAETAEEDEAAQAPEGPRAQAAEKVIRPDLIDRRIAAVMR